MPKVKPDEVLEYLKQAKLNPTPRAIAEALEVLKDKDARGCNHGHCSIPRHAESGLCPICGEVITVTGNTTDGRIIGSCFDAFTVESWDEPC